jgi:16S rRNA processing protein RimM
MPVADELIRIGNLYKAHGIRGEIKMYPETDDLSRLTDVREVFIGKSIDRVKSFTIKAMRFHETSKHPFILLQIEGLKDRTEVEVLQGQGVYAREDSLPALSEDEYFLDDLEGMDAVTDTGEYIGEILEWLEFPSQDMLVIRREPNPDDKPNILVPIVPEFIVEVDLEAQKVVIRPIEGLLD